MGLGKIPIALPQSIRPQRNIIRVLHQIKEANKTRLMRRTAQLIPSILSSWMMLDYRFKGSAHWAPRSQEKTQSSSRLGVRSTPRQLLARVREHHPCALCLWDSPRWRGRGLSFAGMVGAGDEVKFVITIKAAEPGTAQSAPPRDGKSGASARTDLRATARDLASLWDALG